MEIMTAAIIMAMVMVPLFLMHSQTMDTISYTEDELMAFSIAQREIERMKSWNSVNKQSLEHLSILVKSESASNPKTEENSKFRYFRSIDSVASLNPTEIPAELMNAKVGKLTATVLWKDKHGKPRTLSLRCYIEKKYY